MEKFRGCLGKMRSAGYRASKYEDKLDSDVAKDRQERYKKTQKMSFESAVKKQVEIERMVKSIISGSASSMLIHFYCDFGKKAHQLSKRFKGSNLINELEILDNIWLTRGLDPNLMRSIKERVVPSYATFSCCRFDMDNFDESVFCG